MRKVIRQSCGRRPRCGVPLLGAALVCAALGAGVSSAVADTLGDLRAERRAAMQQRLAGTEKGAALAAFGLLVIPVDFADARLPDGWTATSLAPRLYAEEGESLRRYFEVASGGRLDLRVLTADPVHLTGTRRDYSDVDLNGFTRTRALATQSLEALAARGYRFRDADNDGPDLAPGTADDDGMVDGVLILHAGVGQENDPEDGLVQALQYYLEEPVYSGGVGASFYAVASLRSGPGIWAHETAHLLGLEDRYDPLLGAAGGSEVRSRGGLGRFSLMASGAWGTGGGWGAALPDAYSLLQLGWAEDTDVGYDTGAPDTLRSIVGGGRAARIWTHGRREDEHFLLEVRDPVAAAPFDAAVPGGQLLVYHVDESLPEGSWSDDGDRTWHLRVALVEADADDGLHLGREISDGVFDDGGLRDLFPGTTGQSAFGPLTTPSSRGYDGPSGVALTDITPIDGGVALTASHASLPDFTADFAVVANAVAIAVQATGPQYAAPDLVLTLMDDPAAWGTFAGGATSVTVELDQGADGLWRPSAAPAWQPAASVDDDASSRFRLTVRDGGLSQSTERVWCWGSNAAALDFAGAWPGAWTTDSDDGTAWQRWSAAAVRADGGPVLACTAAVHDGGGDWPDVRYANSGAATLTSAPLGSGVTAVRLVHAVDVEMLDALIGIDGGVVEWVAPDGRSVAAAPLDGWRGSIMTKAGHDLHGRNGVVGTMTLSADGTPVWRVDVVPLPADAGPGPWRLRLRFAADALWRGRGWFVAAIDPVTGDPAAAAWRAVWDGELAWNWPFPSAPALYLAESRDDIGTVWTGLLEAPASPLAGEQVLLALGGSPAARREVRVTADGPWGAVATAAVVVYADGGAVAPAVFGRPWPNPAAGGVRLDLEVPGPADASLRIYDVRGALVWRRAYPAGRWLVEWDGSDEHGRRLPSGTYFLRLEGSGPAMTRKVVLLR